MRPQTKVILAGLMLLAGIGAALPYRNHGPNASSRKISNPSVSVGPTFRFDRKVSLEVTTLPEKFSTSDFARSQTSFTGNVKLLPEIRSQNPFSSPSQPPRLSPTYSPLFGPNQASAGDLPEDKPSSSQLKKSFDQKLGAAAALSTLTKSLESSKAKPLLQIPLGRKHTIRDGDSLEGLAEKYLGRKDRYLEIFAANRNVLFSPEQLPIGVIVKIPAQEPSPKVFPEKKASGERSDHRRDAEEPFGKRPLVPVPPAT